MDENERDSLDDMKRQSYQDSLAAKQAYINALEFRIRGLVEGIEKHRMDTWGYGEDVDGKMWQVGNDIDEDLYKLIEKEKP